MKDYIFGQLKDKFKGVNDSILSRVANKLSKGIETEAEADNKVEGYTFAQLLEYESDRRATEATKTATERLEAERYKTKDAQTQSNNSNNNDAEMPTWAKALVEQNKQLQATVTQITAQRIADARKARIVEATQKLPKALRELYAKQSFEGTDEEFDAFINEVSQDVSNAMLDMKQRGAVSGRPLSGNRTEAQPLTKEQEAAITNRGAESGDQPF